MEQGGWRRKERERTRKRERNSSSNILKHLGV